MTTFERIKNIAKKRGLTLTQLNDKAGLGTNSIYHWKSKKPSLDNLQKVANVLGVTVDYLLGNEKKDDKGLTVDEAIDNLRAFQDRPVTSDQKEVLKDLVKGYLERSNK